MGGYGGRKDKGGLEVMVIEGVRLDDWWQEGLGWMGGGKRGQGAYGGRRGQGRWVVVGGVKVGYDGRRGQGRLVVIEGVESRAGIGWRDVYSGCLVLDG